MTRLPLSSQARKVIEYATEEGRQLNHDYVGSEHILLGLLREKDGVGAQVLSKRGITLERVRDEVVKLLRG
jgi:ATP-dependent Clp protease ATP-binding subunit ClpC